MANGSSVLVAQDLKVLQIKEEPQPQIKIEEMTRSQFTSKMLKMKNIKLLKNLKAWIKKPWVTWLENSQM